MNITSEMSQAIAKEISEKRIISKYFTNFSTENPQVISQEILLEFPSESSLHMLSKTSPRIPLKTFHRLPQIP